VLTAAHCVREPGRVEVLWQKRRILAKRVAIDLGNDLALLQLPRRDEDYPALVLAKAPPSPTTPIWLIGTPIYRHGVLLAGAAGAPGTTHEWYARLGRYVRVMHVTATTPPGVSGGPWMNARGEVLALHSGTMTRNDVPVGVGFAVPCTAIAAFLERGRTVATPTLGAAFEEVWEQARSALERYPPRTEGVVVMSPVANGPLADAGVEPWQVVTAIDGHPIRYRDDLLSYVRRQEVGEPVALSLLLPDRGGRKIVRVVLGAMR
jgi:S1-C subfamily serine protease